MFFLAGAATIARHVFSLTSGRDIFAASAITRTALLRRARPPDHAMKNFKMTPLSASIKKKMTHHRRVKRFPFNLQSVAAPDGFLVAMPG
ncbi:hypothetical protein [Methylocapsa palsarum]|uniref:hypothetical protein n=1 Tax=Methylocapsa palsarum TaxID=1612308 RepID=UPI000B848E40|nr:hypothetical protein [Methylocapsa palsarum]